MPIEWNWNQPIPKVDSFFATIFMSLCACAVTCSDGLREKKIAEILCAKSICFTIANCDAHSDIFEISDWLVIFVAV